ncbi:MAG TPA: FG-GAP-like repeat-containing protein [Thermoanaerobaculia bacterium]|nr:FG-GAP-like repeat-containing protein [Thermoanaerobaculia bacterium]
MRTLVLTLCLTIASTAVAQLPAEIQKGQALVAAKDYAGAIAILEPFTAAHPQRPYPWSLLASAYDQNGDLDKALATYERLLQIPAMRAQGLQGVASIHARRKEADEAFAALEQLRDTGSFDMDLLESDPNFAELRKDARFKRLRRDPADFAKPFVENVKILHELRGEAKNSQFGWIARRIGDVDGDKVNDWTTSAPTFAVDNQPAGRVYVYSGKRGTLLWKQTGAAGAQLGTGIEGAGDTNGDGVPDVIAGAPGTGYAYVYSGRDGKPLLKLGTGAVADTFGRHTSTVGDINGDKRDDVIVGAPGVNGSAGAAYIYSGKDGALLLTLAGEKANDSFGSAVAGHLGAKRFVMVGAPGGGPRGTGRVYVYEGLSSKPRFVLDSDESGGAFGGMFLSIPGDTNGDKVPDLFVSDWANRAKGPSTGRVYVYSGSDGRNLLTLTGEAAGDGFGTSDSVAGDVNGDGYADLVVGAWQHASAAPSAGRIYLHSGKTGELLETYTCKTAGDTWGFDTANLGDIDGDGTIDFLVTSAWSGVNGFQSGRVFVISSGVHPAPTSGAPRKNTSSVRTPRSSGSSRRTSGSAPLRRGD